MALSERLERVLQMVPKVQTIADVGTDHGYLAVELIRANKAEQVIAIDVNEGPLQSAQSYIASKGLSSVIDCRLGDGLAVTSSGEVDCAIMCGMGGELMEHIIRVGPEMLGRYVLQPQSHRAELKRFIVQAGYGIVEEACLVENGHYYDIWLVERGQSIYHHLPADSLLWEYGALLKEENSRVWQEYIQKQRAELESIRQKLPIAHPKRLEVEATLQAFRKELYHEN